MGERNLMTGHKGNSFVSQRPSMFPKAELRETLRSRGNKTHVSHRASH